MSKSQPTPLSIPGMPKKGAAAPALTSFEASPSPELPAMQPTPTLSAVAADVPVRSSSTDDLPPARLSSRVQATIAVTVRLDERRYERMKTWGSGRRVTNQEIIVAALDRLFRLSEEEREDAIALVRK